MSVSSLNNNMHPKSPIDPQDRAMLWGFGLVVALLLGVALTIATYQYLSERVAANRPPTPKVDVVCTVAE